MRPRKKDTHLPKCVFHRHGAFWLVKAGKWTRLGADLRTALQNYAKALETPQGGMDDLIDAAMQTMRPRVSKNTWANYQTAARKLKYAFAEFSPAQVTSQHVWTFRDNCADTPGMTNRCLSLLRQVFAYALRRKMVEYNPAVGVEAHDEAGRDRLISLQEYKAIYEKAGGRLQCIMDILYFTGQRVVDVLHLHRANITDDGIYFKQQKTGKKILVQWTPELRAVIARAKALNEIPSLTLFSSRFRKPLDYRSVKLQWDVACKAAGVANAQLRDLRAMSLTDTDEQGKDATALAAHSSAQMTKRYLRKKKIAKVSGPSFGHVQ